MSLINQMLQDLEARSSSTLQTGSTPGPVRAVARPRRSYALWGGAAVLLAVSVAAGAWFLAGQRQGAPVVVVTPAATPIAVAPAAPAAVAGRPDGLKMARDIEALPPPTARAESPAAIVGGAPAAVVDTGPLRAKEPVRIAESRSPASAAAPPADPKAQGDRQVSDPPSMPAVRPEKPKPVEPKSGVAAEATRAIPVEAKGMPVKQVKELTPMQRADNEFRRATALIDDGRNNDAIAVLEQVLQLDPLHGAARQTLVGLLIQGKRQDEAVRKLQEGLKLDSTQAGAAMILARLQVERGEQAAAVGTLQRTLPYAAERADYQAFLAALLQREGRHKDAVEKYLVALGKAPQNGVWWMGMAISLQADSRNAEAREAFLRAKATNTLSPDLLAFVDQKLAQLTR